MPFLAPAFGIFFQNLRGKAKKLLARMMLWYHLQSKRSMDWIKPK